MFLVETGKSLFMGARAAGRDHNVRSRFFFKRGRSFFSWRGQLRRLFEVARVLVRLDRVARFHHDELGASDFYLYINQACCLILRSLQRTPYCSRACFPKMFWGEQPPLIPVWCGGRYFFDQEIGGV